MHSVGVMGDERTYDYAVALRAVTTTDFMTAESYNMPWDVLGTVTNEITRTFNVAMSKIERKIAL